MLAKLEILVKDKSIQSFGYDESGMLVYELNEDNLRKNLEVIYKSRIISINKKSKFAYIEYDVNQQGIINLKNSNLQPGSYLLCQMTWQGNESKLPKFSEDIKLFGKYVILLPNSLKHNFSKELTNCENLSDISSRYPNLGIIFRSSINRISDYKLIEDEIIFLQKQLELLSSWQTKPQGSLTKPSYKFLQLLREATLSSQVNIVTNSQEIFDILLPYLDIWQFDSLTLDESVNIEIEDNQNQAKQNDEFNLEIHKLSGINLIDVNSKSSHLNFFQINYLAIDEIVRQIYLQDLTGIILIDFIKNMSVINSKKLVDRLLRLLNGDWRRNQVLGITQAGICEIIRNK